MPHILGTIPLNGISYQCQQKGVFVVDTAHFMATLTAQIAFMPEVNSTVIAVDRGEVDFLATVLTESPACNTETRVTRLEHIKDPDPPHLMATLTP
jgi:hypothetical protein